MTEKEKQEIINIVHRTILGFFDPSLDEEKYLTETEKTLLEVNKAICNGIKELPTTVERPHGQWICNEDGNYECSECGIAWKDMPAKDAKPVFKACPWCGDAKC